MIQLSYSTWDIIQAFPQETITLLVLLTILPLVSLEALPVDVVRMILISNALACAIVSVYTPPVEL